MASRGERFYATTKGVEMSEPAIKIELELTQDEYATMSLMCGYAAGAAFKAGDQRLANSFVHMANRLHSGDPNFVPYAVGEREMERENVR